MKIVPLNPIMDREDDIDNRDVVSMIGVSERFIIDFAYPNGLLDEEGYLTEKALNMGILSLEPINFIQQ